MDHTFSEFEREHARERIMRAPTEARFPQQQEKSLPFIDKCCRSVGDVKVWQMGRYGPTITHVFIRSFKCCCKHARQPSHAWFVDGDVTAKRGVWEYPCQQSVPAHDSRNPTHFSAVGSDKRF
jgi:hypothetical protein